MQKSVSAWVPPRAMSHAEIRKILASGRPATESTVNPLATRIMSHIFAQLRERTVNHRNCISVVDCAASMRSGAPRADNFAGCRTDSLSIGGDIDRGNKCAASIIYESGTDAEISSLRLRTSATKCRVTHLLGKNLLLTWFWQFWQLLGRYWSCLLPRQDGGTSQI